VAGLANPAAISACSLLLLFTPALAQAEAEPPADQPIYLRVGLGAAWHQAALRVVPASGPDRKANIGAPALGILGAFGFAGDHGINLGFELGIQTGFVSSVGNQSGGFEQYEVSRFFAATGMLIVDWYLDPDADSFHVQAGVGWGGSSYSAKSAGQELRIEPVGWAAQVGIGYELGVTPRLGWSYGLLLRLDAGYYALANARPLPELAIARSTFVTPGLYVTVTLD